MDFNAFFQEYLNLRTKMFPKRSLKSLPWHLWLISGIALLLLLLGCIISFINHDGMMSLPFSFSALLLLVIYSKITTPRNPPKPRKDYTNAFCRLLQDYRISPNNVKAVERFIAYIEKTIKKDDPLEPFVKPFKSIYPLIITIISYCAGTLATSLSWRELLATSVLIIIIIILLAFFSTLIRPIFVDILYSDKHMYQKLLYDLEQLLIFPPAKEDTSNPKTLLANRHHVIVSVNVKKTRSN